MSYEFRISGDVPITINNVVPTTNAAPSAVHFGEYVYVLYSGHDPVNTPSIWQVVLDSTGNWAGNDRVSFPDNVAPETACSPATAVLGDTLYLAWADATTQTIRFATATASADGPIAASGWTPLSGPGGTGPNRCDSGLVMVASPYKGIDSLWCFYLNGNDLAYAIAQPGTEGINWVVNEGSIATDNGTPLSSNCPAATVAPLTAGADALPYVVFVSTNSNGDLRYIDWTGSGFSGNANLKLPPAHFVEQTPQSNRPPCLVTLANKTVSMLLFYKGRHSNDILVSAWADEEWQLNMDIEKIPFAGSKPVVPQTTVGIGAAVYDANTVVLVYPSSQSAGGQQLRAAYIDVIVSS